MKLRAIGPHTQKHRLNCQELGICKELDGHRLHRNPKVMGVPKSPLVHKLFRIDRYGHRHCVKVVMEDRKTRKDITMYW